MRDWKMTITDAGSATVNLPWIGPMMGRPKSAVGLFLKERLKKDGK
jgi:hypothetical protein